MLEIRNQSDLTENHIKRKAAGYQRLSSNWLWLLMATYKPSFPDTKSYRCGLERTGADIGTAPAGGDAIFAPASEEKSAMQGWNTLVVRASIGEDGELSEPEAPAGARFPLPALPARAELRDAEVHAMLGELDFGESAVMGDATAEERQAIANFDIRAFA